MRATVLEAVKGRALERAPQAVSPLDRSCAPLPLRLVGTKGVPRFRPPLAGRTKGGSCGRVFRGTSAPAWRSGCRVGVLWRAQAFGNQVGMLAQPVAGPLDVDDNGVVKQPVEQCGCDHWIAKNLAPFDKAAIGGQDHGAALVAGIDQLEEQIAGTSADAQVTALGND